MEISDCSCSPAENPSLAVATSLCSNVLFFCRRRTANDRRRLFRTVPVHYFGLVACGPQSLSDFFGNHYGAVLTAGATERNSQITLAFADVMGQQIDQ